VFRARIGDVSGGGKLAGDMREIWMMQPRFEKRVGNSAFGMVDQPRFRAAFDFMRLRADVGEVEEVLADWWQEFSLADDNLRQDMVDQVREEQSQRQRPARFTGRRRHRPGSVGRRRGARSSFARRAIGRCVAGLVCGRQRPRKRRRRRRPAGARPPGDADAPSGGPDA